MKFDNINQKAQEEALEVLQTVDNKEEAIVQAFNILNLAGNAAIVQEIQEEARQAEVDKEYRNKLGLRTLSKEETSFYEKFENLKQAITAEQIDIIPTTIIDSSLEDVKKNSALMKLVNFTPATVKKWLVAEKSGIASWGGLTDALTAELSATFKTINIELAKLHVYLVIPKSIRDLGLPFVDRYFNAILAEAFNDGLETGFLVGDGNNMPIGIYKKMNESTNGIHADKDVLDTIKGFSPAEMAPIKIALSDEGKRVLDKIYLVCNPLDCYKYVEPALYGQAFDGGYVQKTTMPIEIIPCANNPEGKAAFVLGGKYTMGFYGLKVAEYKETKAIEDADLIVAKAYANGIAIDDNIAVPFDVTKLEEYVPKVKQIA